MKKLAIMIIDLYKILISPLLGQHCRYYPTCSTYAKYCFNKFSFSQALWYSAKRILGCHPFSSGGVDQVPSFRTKVVKE